MSGIKWTASEEAFLRDNYPHMSYEEVASSLGRTRHAVKSKYASMSLFRTDRPKAFTIKEDQYLLANFVNSRISDVAKHLGRHVESVRNRARILGLENLETQNRRTIAANINHGYFATIDSPEKAYALGLLVSDGYISSATNSIGIKVHPKDLEIVQFLRDQLSSSSKIGHYTLPPLPGYTAERPYVVFSVSSAQIKHDLNGLGVTPRKSFSVTYPAISREFENSFILGCFDGDGCLQVNPGNWRWELYSASEGFLTDVHTAINEHLGMNLHRMASKRELHHLRLNGNKVAILDAWLHADMPGLARKRLPGNTSRHGGVDIGTDAR